MCLDFEFTELNFLILLYFNMLRNKMFQHKCIGRILKFTYYVTSLPWNLCNLNECTSIRYKFIEMNYITKKNILITSSWNKFILRMDELFQYPSLRYEQVYKKVFVLSKYMHVFFSKTRDKKICMRRFTTCFHPKLKDSIKD